MREGRKEKGLTEQKKAEREGGRDRRREEGRDGRREGGKTANYTKTPWFVCLLFISVCICKLIWFSNNAGLTK